jgi:DNA-binding protein HU-beta
MAKTDKKAAAKPAAKKAAPAKAAPAKKAPAKAAPAKKAPAKALTKADILDGIAAKAAISKVQAKAAYDALVEIAYAGAKSETGILLPGLGKFVKGQRAARTGRNPATGAVIKIKAAKTLKFKVAKAAKDAVLGK